MVFGMIKKGVKVIARTLFSMAIGMVLVKAKDFAVKKVKKLLKKK